MVSVDVVAPVPATVCWGWRSWRLLGEGSWRFFEEGAAYQKIPSLGFSPGWVRPLRWKRLGCAVHGHDPSVKRR